MSKQQPEDFVEIATSNGIDATDDTRGRVIMLGFYRKGVALILTYAEALALGRLLLRMGHAVAASKGETNGHRT